MANTTDELTITLAKVPVEAAKNLKVAKTVDGLLVIIVDPRVDQGLTKNAAKTGGNNHMVATTGGIMKVGELKMGINIFKGASIDL